MFLGVAFCNVGQRSAYSCASSSLPPPLRCASTSAICLGLVARPTPPDLRKPPLSVSTNSPLGLRPNIIAGLPSHFTVAVVGSCAVSSIPLIAVSIPRLPLSKTSSSGWGIRTPSSSIALSTITCMP